MVPNSANCSNMEQRGNEDEDISAGRCSLISWSTESYSGAEDSEGADNCECN